jgi:heat shock protein beta
MSLSKKAIVLFLVAILLFTLLNAEDTTTASNTDTLLQDAIEKKGEKHEFQAEISQLLSILINSLYSNKDIFLRELISNASDALNKLRFLALTDKNVLNTGENLEIRIQADKDRNVLIIRDTGVGMTHDDLLNNLGTIAKSGTRTFLEKIKKESDMSLIGQFGVGFYSAFLVADQVVVRTKNNEDGKQWLWTSKADNSFVIAEDPSGDSLGRGTELILHLKDDAKEFLDQSNLKNLITKYSEFTHFPIYLYESRNETEEVPVEEEETTTEEKKEEETTGEDVQVEETKTEEEEKPKTKKIEKTINEWNVVNQNKPIWTRSPSAISDEEYNQFYRSLAFTSMDFNDPLARSHFTAEGNVEFTALLFAPAKAPQNMFDPNEQKSKIKLYVKRVFITDSVSDMLPRYLNFIRGIVDSDDLPLNVSREQLQQSKLLNLIKKKLIGKAIQMLQELAEESKKKLEEYKAKKVERDAENSAKELTDEEKKDLEKKDKEELKNADKYKTFWEEFGKSVRLGVIEDQKHRSKLLPLLRYYSSKSEDDLISLDDYIARMKENQKYIYYITGESVSEVKNSPFLEALKKRDYEVLYLVDAIDEYMIQQVPEYEGKKLESITREDLKLGDEDDEEQKKKKEELDKEFEPLTSFLGLVLTAKKIQKAVVGRRTTDSPCVLVAPSYGISANMARIMKAQALGGQSGEKNPYLIMGQLKIMEINTEHPVIIELNNRVKSDLNDKTARSMAQLLYDTALLRSGYDIDQKIEFADRIFEMMSTGLHLDERKTTSSDDAPTVPETEATSEETTHDEL